MDPKKKRSHAEIFKIYKGYKKRIQSGEDVRTVSNGTYLLMGDGLYQRIQNQWGAEIDVEVPTCYILEPFYLIFLILPHA